MAISRVDTVGFTRMAQSLANMSGAPLEKIIDFEAAKVLSAALRLRRRSMLARLARNSGRRNIAPSHLALPAENRPGKR